MITASDATVLALSIIVTIMSATVIAVAVIVRLVRRSPRPPTPTPEYWRMFARVCGARPPDDDEPTSPDIDIDDYR